MENREMEFFKGKTDTAMIKIKFHDKLFKES